MILENDKDNGPRDMLEGSMMILEGMNKIRSEINGRDIGFNKFKGQSYLIKS